MMKTGKCPKCEKVPTSLVFNSMSANPGLGARTGWETITICCPHCNTILGAQIDPIAIKTDIVREILASLGRG